MLFANPPSESILHGLHWLSQVLVDLTSSSIHVAQGDGPKVVFAIGVILILNGATLATL